MISLQHKRVRFSMYYFLDRVIDMILGSKWLNSWYFPETSRSRIGEIHRYSELFVCYILGNWQKFVSVEFYKSPQNSDLRSTVVNLIWMNAENMLNWYFKLLYKKRFFVLKNENEVRTFSQSFNQRSKDTKPKSWFWEFVLLGGVSMYLWSE